MADEAIVLVGGLGTRLRSVVSDVPKPLAPVAGRPFLAWILDRLEACGVRRTVLAAGYRADLLRAAIGMQWRGMCIDYSVEDEPLGTGGAIAQACRRVLGDGVHVVNGDTWLDYDLDAFEASVQASRRSLGVALARVEDVTRYGAVTLQGDCITGFAEKGAAGPGWINGGAYFLSRNAIQELPAEGRYSFEDAVLAPAASQGRAAGFRGTADFIDIGVPNDYRVAQLRFAEGLRATHRPFVDPDAARLLERGDRPRRALFLDRDGVINIDHGYVHTPAATQWREGIFERVRAAHDAGFLPIVVTNQAGIGRGYYSEEQFLEYTRWVHDTFRRHGIPLLATYFCPHHPTAAQGNFLRECGHRKPGADMLMQAMRDWGIDPGASILIGDKPTDRAAALAAGIPEERIEILAADMPFRS